jgi:hypothetical protein
MYKFTEEFIGGNGILRVDVQGGEKINHIVDDMTFFNYRLGSVTLSTDIKKAAPDVVWNKDKAVQDISYKDGVLFLDGDWQAGAVNKILVSMLAFKMEEAGLHPFHSSAVRYKGKTILFLGGENNHGKSMGQIEGCRRGGRVISTETTVTDENGIVQMGSKSVYLRPQQRTKGTERSDLPSQDEGVAIFFNGDPEYINYDDPAPIDLVVMPGIDGHFATKVIPMNKFEREYQTHHSLMNFFGLNQLLSEPGLVMPIVDTDEKRKKRGDFCSRFCADKSYYMIRAKTPQLLMDEIEKLL